MNTNPMRSVYFKHLPMPFGLRLASGRSTEGNKNFYPRVRSNSISSGGNQDNSNKPTNLNLADMLWSNMEDAFKIIAPQLYPPVEAGKISQDAASYASRGLQKNCFCLLQLRPYEGKLDWVFGRIKTATPQNTIPDHLSQTEFLILDTSESIGILKLSSDNVYPTSQVKTWHVKVAAWVEDDEFDNLNALIGDFHNEGFHIEKNGNLKVLADYVGLRLDEKKQQPWIYIVSSKWLSKLETHQLYAVKANLMLLLQNKNRIIINLLSDTTQSLNRYCDLKQGRDLLAFQEAETATEILNILPDLFTNLIQAPLNDLV